MFFKAGPEMSTHNNPRPDLLTTVTQRLVCTAIVLSLLYVGKDILLPTVVAIILGFSLMPLVRRLQRFGLNRTVSVVLVVLTSCILLGNVVLNLGSQLVRIVESLPQYDYNIRNKLSSLDELTLGKAKVALAKADKIVGGFTASNSAQKKVVESSKRDVNAVMSVRLVETEKSPQEVISRVLEVIVHFVEVAGLVLVVLIFVLIDYEVLRDRLIRVVGGRNLRETTAALNEAGSKLTRYFGAQVAVNLLSGCVVGLSMHWLGVPEATFWGALTAVARFIPYVGAWVAMAAATLMAAAIVPEWSLALSTIGVFVVVELGVSQIIEPKLYGHSTGLSPLSVVIGAIFWAALWGPIGLILATPLTLLIVVAARYIPSLQFIEVLLGDVPGLSAAEKFYQRALAGDACELTMNLQRYLRRKSTSEYCDHVLVPFMALAQEDFSRRAITDSEIGHLTQTISAILSMLSRPAKKKQQILEKGKQAKGFSGEVLVLGGASPVLEVHAKLVLSVFNSNGIDGTIEDASRLSDAQFRLGERVRAVVLVAMDLEACSETASHNAYEAVHRQEGVNCFVFIPDANPTQKQAIPADIPAILKSYREVQGACEALLEAQKTNSPA